MGVTIEESLTLTGLPLEDAVNDCLKYMYPNPPTRRWTRDPRAILAELESFCEFERAIGERPCTFRVEFHGFGQWEAVINGRDWECRAEGKTMAEALCRAFIQEQEGEVS
jgi:hypothetical protein